MIYERQREKIIIYQLLYYLQLYQQPELYTDPSCETHCRYPLLSRMQWRCPGSLMSHSLSPWRRRSHQPRMRSQLPRMWRLSRPGVSWCGAGCRGLCSAPCPHRPGCPPGGAAETGSALSTTWVHIVKLDGPSIQYHANLGRLADLRTGSFDLLMLAGVLCPGPGPGA